MSTELNEIDRTEGWGGGGCCYSAHLVADKIIQHELLMSWIIACFHGYGPAEYSLLSEQRCYRWETAVLRLKWKRTWAALHSWFSDKHHGGATVFRTAALATVGKC